MKVAKFSKTRLAAAVALAGVVSAPAALAEIALEEIVVTAQKREQNMQEVPVAVTAFSGLELDAKGLGSVIDLEKSAPNTMLRASRGTSSTLTAYVRGIGQQDPLWGFEPGVGVYVDDVYIARPQGAVMDVFDVERIEVLRGPQGTLYGKNTVGGAIKYVTKKMTGEATGSAKVSIGAYGQEDVLLAGQLPIIQDKLYIGAGVAKMERDGYGSVRTGYDYATNTYSDSEENYNKDLMVYRVSAEFTPTEELFFRLAYDNSDDDTNARCGEIREGNASADINGDTYLSQKSSNDYDGYCSTTHKQNVESDGFSFTASYDLSDEIVLKYVYSEREGSTSTYIDGDGAPTDGFDIPAHYSDDQETHEIQINYTADRFNVVGGIYYFESNAAGEFSAVLNTIGGSPLDGDFLEIMMGGDVDTESLSAYVNGSFDISDSWTITGGLRITQDEKDANLNRQNRNVTDSFQYTKGQGSINGAPYTVSSTTTAISDDDAKEDWSQVSPTIKLDWKATDDVMFYVSYGEGFKSGGFDMRGSASLNPDVVDGYDPETVETWEAGMKAELFDNRLRLNAAVFDMSYEDMQMTVQAAAPAPTFFVSSVLNAGEAEFKGFEVEAQAQFTEGLSGNLSLGYVNANLLSVEDASGDVTDDYQLINVPEWTGQMGLAYDADLGDAGSITISTAVSYRGESKLFANADCGCDQEGGYVLWDASANWYSADEHWTVSAFLKNITDERFVTGGYNFFTGPVSYYGDPRTWTVSVGYQF